MKRKLLVNLFKRLVGFGIFLILISIVGSVRVFAFDLKVDTAIPGGVSAATLDQALVRPNAALAPTLFTRTSGLVLTSPEAFPIASVIDTVNGFAYYSTRSSPGVIVKMRLSDFTRVGQL